MNHIQDFLKISGLLLLLPGTILIVFPDYVGAFMSDHSTLPKVIVLIAGIGLNLSGLLLLHFSKQTKVAQASRLLILIIHLTWLLAAIIALLMNSWITSVNGMTAVGLWMISVSWLAWHLLKYK